MNLGVGRSGRWLPIRATSGSIPDTSIQFRPVSSVEALYPDISSTLNHATS